MSDILHRIKAKLYHSELTDGPNDLIARVLSERSIEIPGVCQSATGRGGASGKPGEMEQHVRNFFKEMAYLACDGFSINTGYFTLDTQIRGIFNSADEKFDPERHSVYFRYHQGELMRHLIPTIEIEIEGLGDVQPVIKNVTDVKSGTVNNLLTPGKILKVRGDKIKLIGDHPDIGIWFAADATGTRTLVETDEIGINNPSELVFTIPELPAGAYRLEVITQFSGSTTPLKEPRTAHLNKTLTIE